MQAQVNYGADCIMSYLERNPHSMDTAEGIMRWWISDNKIDLVTLKLALDLLVQKGKLKRHFHHNGEQYYSLIFQ